MKKAFVTIGIAAVLSMASYVTAFAGWEQMGTAWKYQNTDGVYLANTWAWIDGNNDGIAESYCFDGNGNLYVNVTTPDQYIVNENGAWTVNGVVQTMVVGGEQDTQGQSNSESNSQNNNQQNTDNVQQPANTGVSIWDDPGVSSSTGYSTTDEGYFSGGLK